MADVETTAAAPAEVSPKKTTTKKTSKPQKPAEHPKYSEMVATAIKELKDKKGSSAQAIKKYIATNFKVEEKSVGPRVRSALKKGVSSGQLNQTKGTGASGSFKLNAEVDKPKKSPAKKSTESKSPKKVASSKKTASTAAKAKKTTTKSPAKKTTKSPAKKTTKSPAKKASKSPAKKTTTKKTPTKSTTKATKSPAKKPLAKKATKKPAAKKPAKK